MPDYRLENDVFVIENYDKKAPFCSFLPGLAGEKGIPLWSFYLNRGQGMTSFGYNNKNNQIMQFFPANIAYENTTVKGFRTFVRKNGEYFEPFFATAPEGIKRTMFIKQNSLKIEEIDSIHELKTTVEYFILPEEPVGAMVRNVKFENLGDTADFEVLDGMPKLIAYGMTGDDFARLTYLMRTYFTMLNAENNIPVFLNQVSGEDGDDVKLRAGGYFCMSFDKNGLIPPIYDPYAIFGEEYSFITPLRFTQGGAESVTNYEQIGINKILCAFAAKTFSLKKGEVYELNTFIGYTDSCEIINGIAPKFLKDGYVAEKLERADEIARNLTDDIGSKSGNPLMDMYARQCYLDNFLRGGYPYTFDDKVVHIFSRKHGDPERDYNYFSIAAEYYSQGDGNFRDVSQNRRNDVVFHPECGDFDIKMFFDLMQFDGYNPLFVKGTTFEVLPENVDKANDLIDSLIDGDSKIAKELIANKFTAGSLVNGIYNAGLTLKIDDNEMLNKLLPLCKQNVEASSDKWGYWSDHWDYNMDLVDAYLKIFPDKLENLLFDMGNYKYFDSDLFVRPRSEKYFFDGKKVRQFKTYKLMEDKYDRGYVKNGTNWLKTANGEVYTTCLLEKLVSLGLNKFALLDQEGMGIEMESGRPGWCDSCNGLPSTLGSGMSETFELKRILVFLNETCEKFADKKIAIPTELFDFMKAVESCVDDGSLSQFDYWDKVATVRENFREQTKYEISGKTVEIGCDEIRVIFNKFLDRLNLGIKKAIEYGNGLVPTYFRYIATKYDVLDKTEDNEYPYAKVYEWKTDVVPYFLEGPAKHMTNTESLDEAKDIFTRVKATDMYDEKLKMYKTSGSIENETLELGRLRAFTAGWQERESVFLHMEYKYLLSMLEAGIYDIFFDELKGAYIPFQSPEVYGRSILENSSFIATTVNPDPNLHGKGYMARLSGSTSEVVSIWVNMFLGKAPFIYKDGKLGLNIKPVLPDWMFDENGEVSFNFLSKSKVTLHNPSKVATYNTEIDYITINSKRFDGECAFGEEVEAIRDGKSTNIEIFYK